MKPERTKVYWLLLPGMEECVERSVVEVTDRTVVLGKPEYFTEEKRAGTNEHWIRVAKERTQRYPLDSVEFVEEAIKEHHRDC